MAKVRSLDEIKKLLENHEEELKKRYDIKELGIFGSYVRNEQNEKSDLDILVDFCEPNNIDLIKFVELEKYLSELFNIKVDLVMKTALKPNIGINILKEVIYL